MSRFLPIVLAAALLVAGSTACGPPASSPSAATGDIPELSDEIIHERINEARVYDIPPEGGKGDPVPWSFDFDEPKEITIITREVNGKTATIVLDIKTRTNPKRKGPARYVAGRIRTDWRLETGWVLRRWEIVNTENISMKYRDDPPPSLPPPSPPGPTR